MRSLLAIAGLSFWMSYVLVCPANGIDMNVLNLDSIYFPDQAEYLKLSVKCPENMILWPGTRRCYREGEQGPCNIGRVLILDKRLLKPDCKDEFVPFK